MGSQGKYAGQPHSFACSVCRKSAGFSNHVTGRTSDTVGRRYATTGRTRKQRSKGGNYHGWGEVAFEYRCLGCGHVGWSRHPSVARKFEREHAA
jgi:hypothetical protein